MCRPFPLPSVRLVVAAGLLAAGVACLPGRAAAQCGDHVLIAGQPIADHPSHPDSSPALPKKPCHGPNCSSNPTTPTVPPTAPSDGRGSAERWAAGFLAAIASDASSQTLPPLTSDAGTVRRPDPLLDPPRV